MSIAVDKLDQRADQLRNEDKETLIGIILTHELEALEVSEIAFGDMYEGREPFTKADIIERLEEFEAKAYYFDNCVEMAAKDTSVVASGIRKAEQAAKTGVHMYIRMLNIMDDVREELEDE